jgi:hypothetical protein
MKRLREYGPRSRMGRGLKAAAAALLVVTALGAPDLAYAGPHGGGGGFHGGSGGLHGGGGGFHPAIGGFHAGMIHGAAIREGFAGSQDGFNDRHGGRLIYLPGTYGAYPTDDYDDGDQPSPSQVWYYCADPAGYYPYVIQCSTSWQMVPAG